MMKCPICDKDITDFSDEYLGSTLMEEHATCKDAHHFYGYEYVTGNTRITLGNVVFYSHYRDTSEQLSLQDKQYQAVLELEKEYYKNKKATD